MTEKTKPLSNHDISDMKQTYANVTMLQATSVDLGIGFGLTEFVEADEMTAKYHTMIRMSFEQARRLIDNLNDVLQNVDNIKEEHD
jgi:hypothetical protein